MKRLVFLAVMTAVGCADQPDAPFLAPQTLGGVEVDIDTLNRGARAYAFYCAMCHGVEGDGNGPAAAGLQTRPRDLRLASYKFAGVAEGSLPHDEDLARVIRFGLKGTAMVAWELPDETLNALVQYIKTFSPEGEGWRDPDMELGEQIVAGADPFEGRHAEGAARGRSVYHGPAGCYTCHAAYQTPDEINEARKAAGKEAVDGLRPGLWRSELRTSETYEAKIMPPDFLVNVVRAGDSPADLYRVIAAGIPGTAMPAWKGSLPEEDIWAMAHYVHQLLQVRGTAAAATIRERVRATAGGQ